MKQGTGWLRRIPVVKTPVGKLALGGVMTALSLVLQVLGGLLGIGTYAAPILGGLCTAVLLCRSDRRTAWLHWAATALLGLLLCPDRELMLLYCLLVGWYPLLLPGLQGLGRWLRRTCKALLCAGLLLAAYSLLWWIVFDGSWAALGFGGLWTTALAALLGEVLFFLYDRLLLRMMGPYFPELVRKNGDDASRNGN